MGTAPAQERRLRRGLALIAEHRFFEAHEELEEAWRAASRADRDFFQGLVHVAVAWYQAGRGNRYACRRQLAKAAARLQAFRPAHRGVDVEQLLSALDAAARRVEAGSLELEDSPIR